MNTRSQRLEPLSGVLFGVLLLTGGLLSSVGLPYGSSAADVANFFEDSGTAVTVGGGLVMLSAAPLLWFVACLRRRLDADGDDGHLASIVATAGATSTAVVLAAAASLVGTASRTGFGEGLEPAGAAGAWDLYGSLLGAAFPVAMAVLVAGTVLAARRSGWFSAAAAAASWVLVAGLLVFPVAWIFAGAALVWVAAVSVAMTRQPSSISVPTTRARTAA